MQVESLITPRKINDAIKMAMSAQLIAPMVLEEMLNMTGNHITDLEKQKLIEMIKKINVNEEVIGLTFKGGKKKHKFSRSTRKKSHKIKKGGDDYGTALAFAAGIPVSIFVVMVVSALIVGSLPERQQRYLTNMTFGKLYGKQVPLE